MIRMGLKTRNKDIKKRKDTIMLMKHENFVIYNMICFNIRTSNFTFAFFTNFCDITKAKSQVSKFLTISTFHGTSLFTLLCDQ
jgi:hypothetical protein